MPRAGGRSAAGDGLGRVRQPDPLRRGDTAVGGA